MRNAERSDQWQCEHGQDRSTCNECKADKRAEESVINDALRRAQGASKPEMPAVRPHRAEEKAKPVVAPEVVKDLVDALPADQVLGILENASSKDVPPGFRALREALRKLDVSAKEPEAKAEAKADEPPAKAPAARKPVPGAAARLARHLGHPASRPVPKPAARASEKPSKPPSSPAASRLKLAVDAMDDKTRQELFGLLQLYRDRNKNEDAK